MTILFLILSTKANVNTRQRWQRETWLSDMREGVDYVYLDEPNGEETYDRVAWKYVAWLRANELKHDWYFFCDDDTWVYVERLRAYLKTCAYTEMTGFKGGDFKAFDNTHVTWFSGGAGIAVKNDLLHDMQEYVMKDDITVFHESDTSLGYWAAISSSPVLKTHCRLFRPQQPHHESNRGIKDAITYHYCSMNDFYELNEKR